MVGVDICGFNGNTTEELCSRWMQLGSFYPFSRNHNAIGCISQEPWAFDSIQHIDITRNSLELRYTLLPYFYTLLSQAADIGSTIWNAMIWNFPSDPNCLSIDYQFMVGNGLLVAPALQEGQTSVEAYFPASTWYDINSGEILGSTTQGMTVTMDAPITDIPVAIHGGTIIPTQIPALTTTQSRKNPFVLWIALDEDNSSSGNLYWDDGISLQTMESGKYTTIEYQASDSSVYASVTYNGFDMSHLYLGAIKVYGVTNSVTGVIINGVSSTGNFNYNSSSNMLLISGLILPMNLPFSVEWY